jgi:hypothetical protein
VLFADYPEATVLSERRGPPALRHGLPPRRPEIRKHAEHHIAMLIACRNVNTDDSVRRPGPRRCDRYDFDLRRDRIAGAHGIWSTQFVHAEAENRTASQRPGFDNQPHDQRSGVPSTRG